MRVIQLEVSGRELETVQNILDAVGIDFITTDATREQEDVVVIEFPVPRQAVERVLERLRDAGIDVDDRYRATLNAEFARTSGPDSFVTRLTKNESNYIAREELRERARELTPSALTYYTMTMLGIVVATSGLLLDSPAVVVGSMVIAPQLGAALLSSVGITLNDHQMIVEGFRYQFIGLLLGVLGSALFGKVLLWAMVFPPVLDITTLSQIGGRTSPGLLSVTVGLAAGVGAAFSLVTHDSPTGPLVGVMVSAALVPAAATAGIGVAWGLPHVVIGALVLLTVNVVCINLASPVLLWTVGYRPVGWDAITGSSTRSLRQYSASLFAVSLLVFAVVGSGAILGHQVSFEQRVDASISDVLDRERFEGTELQKTRTEYPSLGLADESQKIHIVVSANRTYPDLGDQIQHEIIKDTGYPITVKIEYVDTEQSSADTEQSSADTEQSSADTDPKRSNQEIQSVVRSTLVSDRFAAIEFEGVNVGVDGTPTTANNVTVFVSSNQSYPALPGILQRRIADLTGIALDVQVEYVDDSVRGPNGSNSSRTERPRF